MWERRFPGRQAFEREALRDKVNALRERVTERGLWEIEISWRLRDGGNVTLRVLFPDTFPYTRPLVTLLDGIARPRRHISPEGILCLLGRDSRQWTPDWTLSRLLEEQLERALREEGPEDPQGEPVEYWWNHAAGEGNFCLIDSAWSVGGSRCGTLQLHVDEDRRETRAITRAYIQRIQDAAGMELASWQSVVPLVLVGAPSITVPWFRLDDAPLPRAALSAQLGEMIAPHTQHLVRAAPIGHGRYARGIAFCFPTELEHGRTGDGWLVVVDSGNGSKPFRPQASARLKQLVQRVLLSTLRAGPVDLVARAPRLEALRQRRVSVVGVGAIGAPVAVELARSGIRELDLIEGDVLEPGNSVRWPLGAASWGMKKAAALRDHLTQHFPSTRVRTHPRMLGVDNTPADGEFLDELLSRSDVVVDASVAWGVSQALSELCRDRGIPYVQAFATPTLQGGCAVLLGGDACLVCLEHHWVEGSIEPPQGDREEPQLIQPPGCSERTFLGEGVDLQEIALQTVRLVTQYFANPGRRSTVQTVSFTNQGLRLPAWRSQQLTAHPDCSCQRS